MINKTLQILFILLYICLGRINAQDFEVSPVIVDFKANSGETMQKKVTIRNYAGHKQAFEFKLSDYILNENGKKIRKPSGTTNRSCSEWISINPSFVELNPNEEFEVTVNINVPKDGFSTKWAMIIVQATTEQSTIYSVDKNVATGIKILPRIVILVNQSPKSNTNYKGKLANLVEVTKVGDKNRSYEVEVENIGDKFIKAKVYLALANIETAKEEKYPPVELTVFPDTKRKALLSLPSDFPKGKFALAAILDYGHRTSLEAVQIMIEN